MKLSYSYFAFVVLLYSVCAANELSLDVRELEKPAVEALDLGKENLLDFERLIAEEKYGKEKAQDYMKYLEKGMASETGVIMIEGQESRWLEIAYWKGFSLREAFIAGYLSGTASK